MAEPNDESSPEEAVKPKKARKSIYGERNVTKQIPKLENVKFSRCIGYGHFSRVFKGVYKNKFPVAIKIIERGDKNLINNEISLLQELNGEPNIIQLYDVYRDPHTVLVFELIDSVDFSDLFESITIDKFRILIHKIVTGIAAAHSHGIVHRDLKMDNILATKDLDVVKIIDWGCGARVSSEMQTNAGARISRPPEMLLNDAQYGTGCDVWAIGIFILDFLTCRAIPWHARSRQEVLVKMSEYFGTADYEKILQRMNRGYPKKVKPEELSATPTRDIIEALNPKVSHLFDSKLLDLMFKLLVPDPKKRITSQQALEHPFFDKIKK
jgi:casein kinase II subunit alpha